MDNTLLTLRTFSLSYQHIYNDDRASRLNPVNETEGLFEKDLNPPVINV